MNAAAIFAWPLLAYLLLQIGMNLLILRRLGATPNKARTAITGAFWASFVNGLYFFAAAVLLRTAGGVSTQAPPDDTTLLWHFLLGLGLGLPLWLLLTWTRKLGQALYGRGEVVFAEEAILRHPPSPRYAGFGIANLAITTPLGREVFFRGLMLPVLANAVGWAWAIAGIAVFEVLMRLNVSWLYQNLAYTLTLCGLFYLTGDAACGLGAAMLSGIVQALVLLRLAIRAQRERAAAQDLAQRGG